MSRRNVHPLRRPAALSATGLALLALMIGSLFAGTGSSRAATTSTLGFAGDTGANSNTKAVVAAARDSGVGAFFNLGDMSYSQVTPESAYCSLIKGSAGTMAYELLAGNHEDGDGPDGIWSNFAKCLPDSLGVTGNYGRQFYVDYPAANPNVRLIMVSPKLTFAEGSTYWSYKAGTQGYNFTQKAIDDARAAGIPFVVVGMHMYCLSMVNYPCYASPDLMNLLVAKRVDLYLQAHDHAYARSKQLAFKGSCTALSVTAFNPDCIADASPSSSYVGGAGTVLATVGPGGRSLNKQDPNKAVSAYFQTYMGSNNNPTYGFLKLDVTDTLLTGTFVRGAGGTYTDRFTIARGSAPSPSASTSTSPGSSTSPSPSPTAPTSTTAAPSPTAPTSTSASPVSTISFSPVADSWVGSDAPSAAHGGESALYVDASPTKVTYLKYDLTSLAGKTVTGAELQVTTTGSAYSGSPDTQTVRSVADTGWTEGGLIYSSRPSTGTASLGTLSGSAGGTTYSIPLQPSAIQAVVGGLASLAIDSNGGDAFYIGSRESTTPARLVVTTQ